MRLTFKPTKLGVEKDPGWLVTINGGLVVILYHDHATGSVGIAAGLDDRYACHWMTWNSLEEAKAAIIDEYSQPFVDA